MSRDTVCSRRYETGLGCGLCGCASHSVFESHGGTISASGEWAGAWRVYVFAIASTWHSLYDDRHPRSSKRRIALRDGRARSYASPLVTGPPVLIPSRARRSARAGLAAEAG